MILTQHLTWSRVIEQDVAPVLAGYLFFVTILWVHARTAPGRPLILRSSSPDPPPQRIGWRRLLAEVVALVLGGFIAYAVIVCVFYFVVSGKATTFLAHALAEGSELAFGVVLPAFLLLTLADRGVRRSVKRFRARGSTA
jgi:hypothetical protein